MSSLSSPPVMMSLPSMPAILWWLSSPAVHVTFLHEEGAHGLVALPLAEHQVDIGFTACPEDLHPQKARRLSRQPDHLLQILFVSVYPVGVDLHPQVAQHAHRMPPREPSCPSAQPRGLR